MEDPITIIDKIQKYLKESYQGLGDTMIGGGVDNMEKYKYMLGQAHAYLKISQEISNLLEPKKEQKKDDDGTIIRFKRDTEN